MPLSNITEQKNILNSKGTTLTTFINDNLSETEKDKKEILILNMKDVIGTEKVIQKVIEKVKKLRKERSNR